MATTNGVLLFSTLQNMKITHKFIHLWEAPNFNAILVLCKKNNFQVRVFSFFCT